MQDIIQTIIIRFLIGGSILAASTVLANLSSPLLAGIIVTIPLELVSLFFVHGKQRTDYALCILIMSIATVFPVLYYYLIAGKTSMTPTMEVVSSFGVWLLFSVAIIYCKPYILDSKKSVL